MSSTDNRLKKHSITVAGHRTSITLENIFWDQLILAAKARNISLNILIAEIDRSRDTNLSSAIRVYVLKNILS